MCLSSLSNRKTFRDHHTVPFLDLETQAKLVRAIEDPATRALVRVLLDTGIRLGEALNLQWDDVDMKRQIIRIQRSKNGRPRDVGFTSRGRDGLQWALEQRQPRVPDRVFADLGLLVGRGEVELRGPFRKAWNAARRKLGMPRLRLHDCRHAFAVTALRAGVPLSELRDALGHSSLVMVLRYARHCPENAADVTRGRLEAFLRKGERAGAETA